MGDRSEFTGRVGFAIGTGRCGTTFLSRVIEHETNVSASHCRQPLVETFHRYCRWYGLPVDDAGFRQSMASVIRSDLASADYSFESSGYLSLSIESLHSAFDAKFVLLVRNPADVVKSHVQKGWYKAPFEQDQPDLALGYQNGEAFHHFLGRIAPRGEEFTRWNTLTQIGKLAWYWSELNRSVLEQFKRLPETHWRVQRLEELDYESYCRLTQFLGFESGLDEETYRSISDSKPNAVKAASTIADWNDIEVNEFESEVVEMAGQFDYEYRVEQLRERMDASTSDRDIGDHSLLRKMREWVGARWG